MRAASKAIYDLCIIAMAVAVMTICAWITVPFHVNFTLQTFAIFLIAGCFSAEISTSATVIYIVLGIVGVPVFSGFNAGISAIMGPTGGFILSFPFCALIISYFSRSRAATTVRYVLSCILSLALSYIAGACWYTFVFAHGSELSLATTAAMCILPFVIPDILKIFLSALVLNRLRPYLQRLPI